MHPQPWDAFAGEQNGVPKHSELEPTAGVVEGHGRPTELSRTRCVNAHCGLRSAHRPGTLRLPECVGIE